MRFWEYYVAGLKRRGFTKRVGALGVGVIMIFSLGGCKLLPKEQVVQAPALVAPAKVEYKLDKVQRGTLVKIFRSKGTLVSANQQSCYFEKSGHIKALHVKPGDEVKKGQLLAELDMGDLTERIKRAELQYELAKLSYEREKARAQDEYALKEAELRFELAKLDYNQIKKEGDKSKLYSSIGGKITNYESVNVGDSIEAFRPLMTVASTDALRLRYKYFGDSDFIQGMKALVNFGGQNYNGKVVVVRKVSGGTEIEISVENMPARASFGDSASFELETARLDGVLKVPKSAVHKFDDQAYVEKLENGIRIEKYVKIGLETDDEVEIIEGLQEGEEIIVE